MKGELIWKVREFINFYFRAKLPGKNSDSNFLNVITDFFRINKSNVKNNEIEIHRLLADKDNSELAFYELGAGGNFKGRKKVKEILSKSVSSKQKCELLQNISKNTGIGDIVEIGTSLGFVSAYLAIGSPEKSVYTFEGNSAVVEYAKGLQNKLKINNVQIIEGDFENTLDLNLSGIDQISFAFIDGNHQENATIKYFEKILKKCNEDSIIVIDDIYWSMGMNQAWNKIKKYQEVSCTIDLFQIGLVFLKPSMMGDYKVIKSRINPFF
jgi:predicted O-methyltransferase YrrM